MITEKAYAKINLTLDIIGKKEDGYHLIETVMQSVSLFDTVSIEKSEKPVIHTSGMFPLIPTDSSNTCIKADEKFREYTGIDGHVSIKIDKKIPSEAGLGGGSSDAAATLRILNRLYDAGLSEKELEKIGAAVGADVAFCVGGKASVCRGIGEIMTPLKNIPKKYLLLVKPMFGVSTPEAYKQFDKKALRSSYGTKHFLNAVENGENPYFYISNDLERAIENADIEVIKAEMLNSGAEAAMMTGSGSCVFGAFSDKKAAERAKSRFVGKYSFCEICKTI